MKIMPLNTVYFELSPKEPIETRQIDLLETSKLLREISLFFHRYANLA